MVGRYLNRKKKAGLNIQDMEELEAEEPLEDQLLQLTTEAISN